MMRTHCITFAVLYSIIFFVHSTHPEASSYHFFLYSTHPKASSYHPNNCCAQDIQGWKIEYGEGAIMRIAIILSIVVTGLLTPVLSQASDLILETPQLIVSDNTGNLSDARLRQLGNLAQETLTKVLEFWSADCGIGQFGKIRVVFDVPRWLDYYVSVFYWERRDGQRVRIVRVFGSERAPQDMAHKLTSALFSHEDKLIRNMMGVPTEEKVGNLLSHPGCGFYSDDWVRAFIKMKSLIPLAELGPDHASWGQKDTGKGFPMVVDRAKQSKAYAEAGSFGNHIILTYGINKMKRFYELGQKRRLWKESFGSDLQELESNWLKALQTNKTKEENASILSELFERNPNTACLEATKLVITKQ
jgi:hypothetical protein